MQKCRAKTILLRAKPAYFDPNLVCRSHAEHRRGCSKATMDYSHQKKTSKGKLGTQEKRSYPPSRLLEDQMLSSYPLNSFEVQTLGVKIA
jgi:hypothetical protein